LRGKECWKKDAHGKNTDRRRPEIGSLSTRGIQSRPEKCLGGLLLNHMSQVEGGRICPQIREHAKPLLLVRYDVKG